jgi:glycosyltransferase involved in cell wall biosynthesis
MASVTSAAPIVVVVVNQAWTAWKFRMRLIESIRAAGYRVVLMAGRDDSFDRLALACDELIEIRMALRRISLAADLRTALDYVRHLKRLNPVAVLSFTIKPNIYASLACRWLSIPVINNVTGLGTAQRSGRLLAWIVGLLYRASFSRSRCVFFQNPDDLREFLARKFVSPEQSTLLPGSGVDTDYYRPEPNRPPSTGLRVCMLARLLRDKGVAEFAAAAALVRQQHPKVRFDLWGIIDASDSRCVSRAEIAQWEADGRLVFCGEARDALEAFAEADLVVLPSYYPEGTPRTLLEAASMGLPCVTTDMPGCRIAVVDGSTGLLCAPRDVVSLAKAIGKVASMSQEERSAMGHRARARTIVEFDEGIVLEAYRRQLEALCARPQQRTLWR